MAKLKAPLLSLGAAGAIGKAIVFFGWKGLDVAREYVIPSNPKTAGQTTQRGYLAAAVGRIHDAQANVPNELDEDDSMAYALWGSTFATPRTWFNQAVKNAVDQQVAGKDLIIFRNGSVTPAAGQLTISLDMQGAPCTAGNFHYGTTKTALINVIAATVAGANASKAIPALTAGVKYYIQFRPTANAAKIGIRSGIYYGTPT